MPLLMKVQTIVNLFLFFVTALTERSPKWNLNYLAAYGERISGLFEYNGVDQTFSVAGYLGDRFTLHANAAIDFARSGCAIFYDTCIMVIFSNATRDLNTQNDYSNRH